MVYVKCTIKNAIHEINIEEEKLPRNIFDLPAECFVQLSTGTLVASPIIADSQGRKLIGDHCSVLSLSITIGVAYSCVCRE